MQHKTKKSLQLIKKLGKTIKKMRDSRGISCTELAYSFDIDKGNLSRIENGLIDCKFTTLWKISEALNMKLSELVSCLEKEMGSNFSLGIEEE